MAQRSDEGHENAVRGSRVRASKHAVNVTTTRTRLLVVNAHDRHHPPEGRSHTVTYIRVEFFEHSNRHSFRKGTALITEVENPCCAHQMTNRRA
jgi:hypothetical protein